MDNDSRDRERPTLPPCDAELELVTEFERVARVDEKRARLAQLAELMAWREAQEKRHAE